MREKLNRFSVRIGFVIVVSLLGGYFFDNFLLQPKIQVTPTDIDFGTCSTGDILRKTIKISNIGSRHLSIIKISTSCNCTTLKSVPSILGRWKSVDVQIGVRAGTFPKRLFESVVIESNDKSNSLVQVNLHATVKELIRAVPDKVDFGIQLYDKLPIRNGIITLYSDDSDWLTKYEIVGDGAISLVKIYKNQSDNTATVTYNFNSGGFLGFLNGAIYVRKIGETGSALTVPISAQIVSSSPSIDHTFLYFRINNNQQQ